MNLPVLRTDFGLTKKPRVFSLVLGAILLFSSLSSWALIKAVPQQCQLLFATDYRSQQWSVDALVTDYLRLDFFGREMKKDFIEAMKGNLRDQNAIFLDVENAMLKTLNDLTNDKMLITSLTNLHKKILSDAIIRLIRNNQSNVTLAYSDFKSMRFKFQFTTLSESARLQFVSSLKATFESINREYIVALEKLNMNLLGSAHLWFRGGVGFTADEANIAARASRENKSHNSLMDFGSRELRELIWSWKVKAEKSRLILSQIFGRTPVFTEDGFLTADVIDVIRKSSTTAELIQRFRKKYRVELMPYQAEMFRRYLENVDRFAPGIYVVERRIASLEPAEFGGLSADFAGLGAKNLESTARALAGARDIEEVLLRARENEQKVTREFMALLQRFDEVLASFFDARIPSGDDFVGYGRRVLSFQDRMSIMKLVAAMPNPSGQRIAFIASGVKKKSDDGVSHRGLLAAHGESIEKDLRKALEGVIPHEILKQVAFGLDMLGSLAGEGDVQLLLGVGAGVNLTDLQITAIKTHFRNVVQEFNKKKENSVPVKKYRAGPVLF